MITEILKGAGIPWKNVAHKAAVFGSLAGVMAAAGARSGARDKRNIRKVLGEVGITPRDEDMPKALRHAKRYGAMTMGVAPWSKGIDYLYEQIEKMTPEQKKKMHELTGKWHRLSNIDLAAFIGSREKDFEGLQ